MIPWKGIYLSPVNNDKAKIKIPGSTATDSSNLKDDWRILIGSKFGVDSNGTLYANGGYFTGDITATSGYIGNWLISSYLPDNATSPSFGESPLYWNRVVSPGALLGLNYEDVNSNEEVSGKLFGWPIGSWKKITKNNVSKYALKSYYGIYLSPANNKKSYIAIPGTDVGTSQEPNTDNFRDDWRILIGSNFGVTSDGSIYATSGTFSGKVDLVAAQVRGKVGN